MPALRVQIPQVLLTGFLLNQSAEVRGALLKMHLDEQRMHAAARAIAEDRAVISEAAAYLPAWLKELFKSDAFKAQALAEFTALCPPDQDGIANDKLFPVVVELSAKQPIPVTERQCATFAQYFDANADGVLQRDEFFGFVTFLWTASFLAQDSPEALRAKLCFF